MSARAPALLLVTGVVLGAGSSAFAADPARSPQGHAVFEKWCAPCHGRGPDKPGTVALETLYKGTKPGMLEERTDLTPDIVKHFVRTGVTVMPFFRKTEINDADLDALALYLSSPSRKSTGG